MRARVYFPCLRRKDSHWIIGPIGRLLMTRNGPKREILRWSPSQLELVTTGHRSLSPFLWNWTWPPSPGPSYKAYSDSTSLPLTRSSRALCSVAFLSPLPFLIHLCIFIKSSFLSPSPTTLHHARRVKTHPKRCPPLAPRRVPQSLQLPLRATASKEPCTCIGLHFIDVRTTRCGE